MAGQMRSNRPEETREFASRMRRKWAKTPTRVELDKYDDAVEFYESRCVSVSEDYSQYRDSARLRSLESLESSRPPESSEPSVSSRRRRLSFESFIRDIILSP
jgi:hypothetical protein